MRMFDSMRHISMVTQCVDFQMANLSGYTWHLYQTATGRQIVIKTQFMVNKGRISFYS